MGRVIVNGCFDVLHSGHIHLLNAARLHGDHLLVAIDGDARVRALKGRLPVFDSDFRARQLQALRAVDEVVVFGSDEQLLSLVERSDIMVKGSDYIGRPIIGADRVEVVFVDVLKVGDEKISSSNWR